MLGIVLETNEKETAVLCDNGDVSKIRNRHYKKGQVIKMNNKFKFISKVGCIAVSLAVTAATGFAYTTPSTYVSLDVNPSIEYQLNAFDRVISVIAVNDDGEKIVNEIDLKNDKIQKAILKTIEKLEAEGYLTENEYAGIVIAVSNKDKKKSDELANDIEDKINKNEYANLENEIKAKTEETEETEETDTVENDIQLVVEAVGRERVEEARKLKVTPGKLNLVQKLIESTDDFDDINEEQLNELLELSVKEINKMTTAYKKGIEIEKNEDDIVEEDVKNVENVENADDDKLNKKDINNKNNNKIKKEENKKLKAEKSYDENEFDYDDKDENTKVNSKGNNNKNNNKKNN